MNPFVAKVTKWGLFCLLLGFCSCGGEQETSSPPPPPSQAPPVETDLDALNVYVMAGDYYEMKIGVKGNQLTGIYQHPDASNSSACRFFFEGTLGTQNPVRVKCYNPMDLQAPYNGTFKMLGDALIARLNRLPAEGCEPEFTDAVGRSVVMDMQHDWLEIRMVEQKTALYEDAMAGLTVGNPLTKGMVVAVKEKKGSWLLVDVLDGKNEQGWIQDYVLYPLLER